MSTVTCEFCKRSIDPHEAGVHQYTTGWVKNREGGGGHGISLPTRLPRWACFGCMDRKLKGHIRADQSARCPGEHADRDARCVMAEAH